MVEIFQRRNYNLSDLRILHGLITRFFSLFLSYLLNNIYFVLLFSKMRQHFRCNLLFGLTGHFGLLKDVNFSFFLASLPSTFHSFQHVFTLSHFKQSSPFSLSKIHIIILLSWNKTIIFANYVVKGQS